MPLNSNFLKRINEKTVDEPHIREFIVELLKFQSEPDSRWRQKYIALIEQAYKEVEDSANN